MEKRRDENSRMGLDSIWIGLHILAIEVGVLFVSGPVSQGLKHHWIGYNMNEETLSNLDSDEIEEIEKLTLRWIFQAVLDFGMEAHEVFLKSPDNVKDIAEILQENYLIVFQGLMSNKGSTEMLITNGLGISFCQKKQ